MLPFKKLKNTVFYAHVTPCYEVETNTGLKYQAFRGRF